MPLTVKRFRELWSSGCGSNLCSEAQHICLWRGDIPCDILFVGEAPSIPADVVGEPFTGEIRAIVDDAIKQAGAVGFTAAYTNLVCCVPRNPENRSKVLSPPPGEAIIACRRRLQDFLRLCRPRLIVAVGRSAQDALREMQAEQAFPAPVAGMPHPATVLYARPYGGYEFRLLRDALAKAVAEHLTDKPE
jgi:DNA polymerase